MRYMWNGGEFCVILFMDANSASDLAGHSPHQTMGVCGIL